MAVRQFYSGGNGSVAFDTDRGTFTVGHALSSEEAGRIVERVRQLVPQLVRTRRQPVGRRRGVANHAAAFMTMTMLGFALNVPFRIAIIDRPICFYDDAAVPRRSIDVSATRPPGKVYLVPIGDFPVERARRIAEHFRTKFGAAIEVAPAIAWPDDAYDPGRRQMNSAVMLTRLDAIYGTAGRPVVAIGLTTRDMFNSDVNWKYVFSYRRDNRLAVVSPARMDRGCMGVFPADEERIAARLRKMVGKNIGTPVLRSRHERRSGQHALWQYRRTAGARRDERVVLSARAHVCRACRAGLQAPGLPAAERAGPYRER